MEGHVFEALNELGATTREKNYVQELGEFKKRKLKGIDQDHERLKERLAERIARLRTVIYDRAQGNEQRADESGAALKIFDWREGNLMDSREEYRQWTHVAFVLGGPRKERGRAYIDLWQHPSGRRSRVNADICWSNGHAHVVNQLIPGEPYHIPVIMRLESHVALWLDSMRTAQRGPDILEPGTYITDSDFLAERHRVPLSAGDWSISVVLILGDVDRDVERETKQRVFEVA